MQRRLYGSNICGEGGEYETLALGGPLFRHASIRLDKWDVRLHSQDSVAPVGVLHPLAFHLIPKVAEAANRDEVAGLTAAASDMRLADDSSSSGGDARHLAKGVITVPATFWAAAEPSRRGA